MYKLLQVSGRSRYLSYFTCVLILSGVSAAVYRNIRELEQINTSRRESAQVLREFDALASSLKDAETSQRGFLLTGNPAYLAPYAPARQQTLTHLVNARESRAQWVGSADDLDLLENLLKGKFDEMGKTIELRRSGNAGAAKRLVATDIGRAYMDQIRGHMAVFEKKQLQLIAQLERNANAARHRSMLVGLLGLLLAAAISGVSLALGQIDDARRRSAERALVRFRTAVDVSADFLFIVDREAMCLVDVNETVCDRLGYSRQELLNSGARRIYVRAQTGDIEEEFDRAIAAIPRTFSERGQLCTRDGRQIPVEVNRRGLIIGGRPHIVALARDMTGHVRQEAELAESRLRLENTLDGLQRINEKISLQARFNAGLQACSTVEEIFETVRKSGPHLFPYLAGAIYLQNHSKTLFEKVTMWGDTIAAEPFFEPGQCWAMRRGQPYSVLHAAADAVCRHVETAAQGNRPYLCVPLTAQNDTLGLLYLELADVGASANQAALESVVDTSLASKVGESLAKAIANLKLRETLQFQSIRDPLTGLYNRRFLEDAFRRELSRAERKSASLSVIAADVDHFKRLNDTHGHEAGDVALKQVADLMRAKVRDIDVVCRMGGEEFCILMPDTDAETAARRADLLRTSISAAPIAYGGQILGTCTMSFGIATFPQHGDDWDRLMPVADRALYEAKHKGRNQVRIGTAR
jgi:diguanylate cyclase (GGDEF)-like protein/PAS domain S-box-containing protein